MSISLPSSLRDRFLPYGPRATKTATAPAPAPAPSDDAAASCRPDAQASEPSPAPRHASRSGILDYLATWQVPHSYFTQFYITSVASSIFWAAQLVWRGRIFHAIASRVSEEHSQQSMALTQVLICWILLAIQGSRRLWESFIFAKPSTSKMSIAHWLLGLGFYLAAGVAIWIEGSGTQALSSFPRVKVVDFGLTILSRSQERSRPPV